MSKFATNSNDSPYELGHLNLKMPIFRLPGKYPFKLNFFFSLSNNIICCSPRTISTASWGSLKPIAVDLYPPPPRSPLIYWHQAHYRHRCLQGLAEAQARHHRHAHRRGHHFHHRQLLSQTSASAEWGCCWVCYKWILSQCIDRCGDAQGPTGIGVTVVGYGNTAIITVIVGCWRPLCPHAGANWRQLGIAHKVSYKMSRITTVAFKLISQTCGLGPIAGKVLQLPELTSVMAN